MQISTTTTFKSPLSNFKDIQDNHSNGYSNADYINDKLTFTRMMNERLFEFYNQKGKVNYNENIDDDDNPEDIEKRESTRKEIWKQTYSLLQEAIAKLRLDAKTVQAYDKNGRPDEETADPFGVAAYYAEHPEDLKKVQLGIIPDYFNVENTGNRILKIWFPETDSAKDQQDVPGAVKNIGKAYSEVGAMFGDKLPQLVLDTRDYVLGKVQEMK
ncbi:hypothetical protein JXQ31_20975 [candidate division KSB1 bacterium]|nr:hypothetical protein [candidate division KSB1 bacterium]